jgi:hypothetical protein
MCGACLSLLTPDLFFVEQSLSPSLLVGWRTTDARRSVTTSSLVSLDCLTTTARSWTATTLLSTVLNSRRVLRFVLRPRSSLRSVQCPCLTYLPCSLHPKGHQLRRALCQRRTPLETTSPHRLFSSVLPATRWNQRVRLLSRFKRLRVDERNAGIGSRGPLVPGLSCFGVCLTDDRAGSL